MKLRAVIEPDEDVYGAYCPELPGRVSYHSGDIIRPKTFKKILEGATSSVVV